MGKYFINDAIRQETNNEVDLVDLFFGDEKKYIGKYIGSVLNNSPNGAGNIIFTNGDEYFGQFNDGIIEGRGILIETVGNEYDGNFLNGKKHGIGIMTYSNGDKYDGEWIDDLRHGKGVLYYANGDEFIGVWYKDLRHGKGRLKRTDGDIFDGEWCDNNWYDKSKPDPLFKDAAKLVVIYQQGSTSLIQRKLNLKYNRAGRLIDQLEAAGIVASFEGSNGRDVLIPDEAALTILLENLGFNVED